MKMSRIESAVRIVLAFNEAFNRQDVPGMMQLLGDGCILEHSQPPPDGAVFSGKAAIAEFWQNFFRESPQARLEIEDVFSAGYRCVVRRRHIGAGEEGYVRGVDIFQVKNGLICEMMSYVKG